jgi:restriction endonuclease S subunit
MAAILDQADALRAKRREALAQLEKLRRNEIKLLNAAPSEALPEMYSTAAGLEW